MKIGVCFKILPDFEDTDPSEWENPRELDFRYVKKIYGCFDEAALETALRLQDHLLSAGEPVQTVAVTVGPPDSAAAESLLRGLFAAGFGDVVTIPEGSDFQPRYTAEALAGYFRENPADLIFCGRMVGPADTGMVPLYLAQALGYRFFPEVSAAAFNSGSVTLTCRDEKHLHRWQVTGPAVCAVGDAEAAYLRLFPLKARMAARNRTFTSWPQPASAPAPEVALLAEKKNATPCRYLDPELAPRELLDILKGVGTQ